MSLSVPMGMNSPVWLQRTALLLAVCGVLFRFAGLADKPFWPDETITALVAAGSGMVEVRSEIFDGSVHTIDEVLAYQFSRPGTSVADTIRVLAAEDSKHVPLYYVVARWWMMMFGSSVWVLRALSALLGLLAMPLAYLLCRDLFEDRSVAWVAVCLFAVSPVHWVYGQEAQPYTLWVDLILLSSWLLVQIRRRADHPSAWRWSAAYCAVMTATVFTHLVTVVVAVAHMLWILLDQGPRLTPTVRRTLIPLALAGAMVVPWLLVMISNFDQQARGLGWAAIRVPFTL